MPDLSTELANLNANARDLLHKYDGVFDRLDQSRDAFIQQIAQKGQEALDSIRQALDSGEVATARNALALQGKSLEELSGELSALVVAVPTTTGSLVATAGYPKTFTFYSDSYLDDNVSVSKFSITVDGGEEEIDATDGSAAWTHTFDGAAGETKSIRVVAVDSVGNVSSAASFDIALVENNPPTAPTITAPESVTKNSDFTVSFSGSTDADGDAITYSVTDAGPFTFSKTSGIAENEEVTVTAPDVTADTDYTFSVSAVDANGLESEASIASVRVKNIIPYEGTLYKTYDTAGTFTFTIPDVTDTIEVEVWGAGGGGGSSGNGSGGAGGNGGYAKSRLSVTPGEAVTVIVGQGGAGGHYGDVGVYGGSGDGWHGETTSFGDYLFATGGQAGHGGESSPANAGGAGGEGTNGNIDNSVGASGCDNCGANASNQDLGVAENAVGGAACYTDCYAQDGGAGLVKIYT